MRSSNLHIDERFPKHLFWDVDPSTLDVDRDRDLIIPRALIATTPESFNTDISRLEELYSRSTIAKELMSTKERISNQVCLMVARRYHKKKFTRFQRNGSGK